MTTDPEAVSQIYTVIWLAVATASWAGIIALAVKWKRAQPISSSGVVAALQHARKLIVNNPEHQARAVAFRTHQSFVGQHTLLINALRGYLAEFGLERAALNLTQVAHSNCLLSHRFFAENRFPLFRTML